MTISPLFGCKRPLMSLIKVVLPLPFGPNNPIILPFGIVMVKSSIAFFHDKILKHDVVAIGVPLL